MPSLTPLHETYCRIDDRPLSQADVLEGLAQLLSSRLGGAVHHVVFAIQRELLFNFLGINELQSQKLLYLPYVKKFIKLPHKPHNTLVSFCWHQGYATSWMYFLNYIKKSSIRVCIF